MNLIRRTVFAVLLPGLLGPAVIASDSVPKTPALVVVVSVDQLAYDYLQRFRHNFTDDGLTAQALKQGIWFSNCKHQHAFTHTGPGHAVLMTGAYPNRHGIIGNSWYSRKLRRLMYCVTDPQTRLIGAESADAPVSPSLLEADTVGDQLKLATRGRSRVFGVAIKDRAAILMAGRLGDAAIWMSNEGHWITSSHYTRTLPDSVVELNASRAVWRFAGASWTRHLDAAAYVHGEVEESSVERPQYEMTADFPHRLPAADHQYYIRNLACSPFGNVATLEAARTLIIGEELGRDDYPDLLGINLTANDYVGHSFGPHSLEVEDMVYRTDIQLGRFATFLRKRLNGRPFAMFVTSDHGVGPVPEHPLAKKLNPVREPLGRIDSVTGNIPEMELALEAFLAEKFRLTDKRRAENPIGLVHAFVEHEVYLNREHPALAGDQFEVACNLTRDWVLQHPSIVAAMTRQEILREAPQGDQLPALLRRSFHVRRSGDVLFVLKPYHLQSTAAASHGSPWEYDRHVPLLVVGDLRPVVSDKDVSPASIGPTIAELLQIQRPSMSDAAPLTDVRLK